MTNESNIYKIVYLIPYFGKLGDDFKLWLKTCKYNETIDFFIFTDDITLEYIPDNVKIKYMTFDDFKEKVQENFDFKINLNTPYKICDYRVAFGEIFETEIIEYDFWGHCDFDQIWGNIRKFITDDILESYDRIGFQGHSCLYKNDKSINARYKLKIENEEIYKRVFTIDKNCYFDENIMNRIYKEYNFSNYTEVIFATLCTMHYNFYLNYIPNKYDKYQKHQIFVWENGTLNQLYIKNSIIEKKEYMYIHFLARDMKQEFVNSEVTKIYIYPNVLTDSEIELSVNNLKKITKDKMFFYFLLRWNRCEHDIVKFGRYMYYWIKRKIYKLKNNDKIKYYRKGDF